MPAYMALQRSSSAGLAKIHRSSTAAGSSPSWRRGESPSPRNPLHRRSGSAPIPPAPGGVTAKKPAAAALILRAAANKPSAPPPPPCCAFASVPRAPRRDVLALKTPPPQPPPLPSSSAASELPIKKGTTVRVCTRLGTLPMGQRLVLWLIAAVVSAAEEGGCLEVIYNGDFPHDDPFRTVRVAKDEVKNMPQHQ